MAVTYKVDAQLRVNAANAVRGIRSASSAVDRLRERFAAAKSSSDGMIRSMLATAGAYAAISAASQIARRTIGGVFDYANLVEQASIQIATLSNRIEGVPFEAAETRARGFIEQLEDLAIQSPATGRDLIGLFQGLSGPIARVTGQMSDALVISQQLANTASALGVDYEQAGRDFRAMLEGRAGADVLLFSRLRSVGAISETTEAFNAMAQANPAEAYEKLRDVLEGYNVAAARQGRSLDGLTSSFSSLYNRALLSGAEPIVERYKTFLSGVNDRLLANMSRFRGGLQRVGEAIGRQLDALFSRILAGLDYVIANWDAIVVRLERAVYRIGEVVRALPAVAKGLAAVAGARMGARAAIGISGAALGVLGGTNAAGGVLHSLVGAVTRIAGASAATGPLDALMGMFSSPFAIAAAVIKVVAFVAIFALLAGLMAVGASIARELTDNWAHWAEVWKREVSPLLAILKHEFVKLWRELRFVMRDLGKGALRILIDMFKNLVIGAIEVIRFFRDMHIMFVVVGDALAAFVNDLLALASAIGMNGREGFDPIERRDPAEIRALVLGRMFDIDPQAILNPEAYRAAEIASMQEDMRADAAAAGGGMDTEQPVQNFDFRGSRITIEQEFANGDPDRVAAVLREDLAGQAERRVASGFVPALSR